jgi:hypothetical protein
LFDYLLYMEQYKREELLSLTKERLVDIIEMLEECMNPQQVRIKELMEKEIPKFDVSSYFESLYDNRYSLVGRYKLKLEKLVEEYGLDNVIEGIKISVIQYDYLKTEQQCFNMASSKLPGILFNKYKKKTGS